MAILFNDHYTYGPGYAPPVQYKYMKVPKPSSVLWSFDPKADHSLPAMEYEVVKVPVGTPYVDRGNHPYIQAGPVRLGCTMEMVSVLAGERWTDRPHTTHPGLALLMVKTNDLLPDKARQEMLELVPRLLDTNVLLDRELSGLILRGFEQAERIGYSTSPLSETHDMLENVRYLLDAFDKRLGRPTRKMDDRTLTKLMTALAA